MPDICTKRNNCLRPMAMADRRDRCGAPSRGPCLRYARKLATATIRQRRATP